MTSSAPPPPEPAGPNRPRILSSRERALLARIETDLTEADPELARDLATRRAPVLGVPPPMSPPQLWLLVAIMVVLSGATQLPSAVWWPVLPLLTVLLVVPWIVYCLWHPTAD